ncbi:FkbM family methyltransferase [Ruegeria sediminis]|uniref:FkbM family methyltransferase n=1 Tax=Ruegeria sediminis TaxID=2583820 RepID=A0ABY2X2F1_9RHOB|nr:FkbM family methyltransferase [Ruegeria sediminis]TMV09014.1 FkbM family methyltransferase [Ruegeria sediminis]
MSTSQLAPVANGLPAVEYLKSQFKILPQGMIQVGAHNGREIRQLARSGVSRGVFIDPLDETFPMLSKRAAQHPGYRAVKALVGDEDGREVEFHVASNSGESSSFLAPDAHLEIKSGISFDTTRKLTLRSLDALLDEQKVDTSEYDLLFVDTQGAELHVLKGGMKTLGRMQFLWMEASIGGIYQGDTALGDFVPFLKTLGFELAWCQMKRLGWGDALFVRRELFAGGKA